VIKLNQGNVEINPFFCGVRCLRFRVHPRRIYQLFVGILMNCEKRFYRCLGKSRANLGRAGAGFGTDFGLGFWA
jgi:hypothetical protein